MPKPAQSRGHHEPGGGGLARRLRGAIPPSWQAHPVRVIAPALGGVAIAYVAVAVAALGTHPTERLHMRDAAMARLEATMFAADTHARPGRQSGTDRAVDADGDGRISVGDVRLRFQELAERAKVDARAGMTREDFIGLGGSLLAFERLDSNRDGLVSIADFPSDSGGKAVVADPPDPITGAGNPGEAGPEPMEWAGVKATDPRNGRELVLDRVRAGWLQEMAALDASGNWRWRGNAIPASEFGTGAYGILTLSDGSKVKCFLRRDFASRVATIVDEDGRVRRLTYGSPETSDIREWAEIGDRLDPAKRWHEAMVALIGRNGASDSAGWAGLALALRSVPGMANEAEDAAKRALIYDPGLAELWPIAGVERKDRQLVRKTE